MKLLKVEDLCVQYPGKTKPACQVSFQVETGEVAGNCRGIRSRKKYSHAGSDGIVAKTGGDHQ